MGTIYLFDSINSPPDEPTPLSRRDFDARDHAQFAWTFNDVNDGDSQSAYQFQIQEVGGSVILDTGKVDDPQGTYLLDPGTLANGNEYVWRVRTWDSHDEEGPYSPDSLFRTLELEHILALEHRKLFALIEGDIELSPHDLILVHRDLVVEQAPPPPPPPPPPLYTVPVLELSRGDRTLVLPFTAEPGHVWCLAPGIEGLDQPATDLLEQRAASQFGSYARGVDVPAREIFLPIMVRADSYQQLLELRDGFNQLTTPYHNRVTRLTVTRPDGRRRYIDGYRVGRPIVWDDRTWHPRIAWQKFGQKFVCTDPWWRGTPSATDWTGSSGSDFFPITPVVVSTTRLIGVPRVIDIRGDVSGYPLWELQGPLTSVTATHVESGRSWTLIAELEGADSGISAEKAIVNTDPRAAAIGPPVRGPDGSSWFRFLEPPYDLWTLPTGPQTLQVEVTGAGPSTRIQAIVVPLWETA